MAPPFKKLKYKFILVIGSVLLVSFGVIFLYMTKLQTNLVIGQAKHQARMLHRQIILTRQWVSDHHGLFVVKTEKARENPYLYSPNLETLEGITLVKRNPAMVTRELSQYAQSAGYGWFRVTSLKPVNPANEPDDFERASLQRFNDVPIDEHTEIESNENNTILRYISPLIVKPSCLTCHARHGYKEGDIRGALSISIPIDWAIETIQRNNRFIFILASFTVLAVICLLYLLFNVLVTTRLSNLEKIMDNYPEETNPIVSKDNKDDEIGRLSVRFAALCSRLDRSRERLDKAREQSFYNEKMASLGQLTAGIAHEINNPLGGLLNCVKNLQDDPDNSELRARYLPLLDKGLHQIESTMRQLLNFGRNEPLQLRKVEVDEDIRQCLSLLEFRMKDIELSLDLGVTTPLCIDTEAIKQIVINIGLNAIQAMEGGGRLSVTSRRTEETLSMVFTDTGIGIDEDTLPKIFDPFFTTKEVGQGTGLGLAVTYALVHKMGGTIQVESKVGQGTTFRVEIPVIDQCSTDSKDDTAEI